eukprot:CAMPEP_0170536966 /NCGR_PEP_ID=MMETSP0209-20121228/102443_1 /TAXON_ID=665100 ORGANISM="Litonotus pictus, Strain P1" /NCGR_SAMPLE_ID=MMETSP0209 /ASSEMBLY_ACC=CAM_ASM_000301 /LENGTH=1224 /DNA_ID=CAMNT_0010838393 /DNA_START=149 /DNA_END=3824 /DNA_ORIENTATION=-
MNNNSSLGNINHNNPQFNSSINEVDEFQGQHVYLKDNTTMINRIKSSTHKLPAHQPKRINSAYPMESKALFKGANSNSSNITLLYEENQKLKSELAKYKIDLSNAKKEITQLEAELDKKDKLVDEIANTTNVSNTLGTGGINAFTAKIIESKLVINIKKQYKDLKKDLAKKNEEMEELKKIVKSTRLNELSIENQTLNEELVKIRNFYKASMKENQNKFQLVKEYEILQENFSKQQFLIINLKEKIDSDGKELEDLRGEVIRDKSGIAERNKKIEQLSRHIESQKEQAKRLMNFKETNEFLHIKAAWEKKITDLKKDLFYYKQTSEKNGSRKKELEDENKRIKDQLKGKDNNFNRESALDNDKEANLVNDNPEENVDTRIKIYKTKLTEMLSELKILEAENKDLKDRLSSGEGGMQAVRNTSNSQVQKLGSFNKQEKEVQSEHNKQDSSLMNKRESALDNDKEANLVNDNPEENVDTRIKIYKTKLTEMLSELKILEAENKDLKDRLSSGEGGMQVVRNTSNSQVQKLGSFNKQEKEVQSEHNKQDSSLMNNTYITNNTKLKVENTNVSSNLLSENPEKDFEITLEEIAEMKSLSDDSFNEIIYILMKNFEANKIDSSVIDSAFPSFENKSSSEIIMNLSKSIMYLLKNKNYEDLKTLCHVLVTFINKTKNDYQEFHKAFLSIFENISLFSGEQKAHYNKYLRRMFKNNKEDLVKEFMLADKQLSLKEGNHNAQYLLEKAKQDLDKKPCFITFVDLRRIFDTLSITIEAELVEYLIYLMKSTFRDEKASFYDLNYLSLVELLYEERSPTEDEKSVNEDEQSYEITPEQYEKILLELFSRIKEFAKKKNVKAIEIFKEDVALVEEENTKQRFNIIELKDFIEKLDNHLCLDLKELEIYCLYTKLKFDEVENELEAISYDKLAKDLEQFEIRTNKEENKTKLKVINMSKEGKLNYRGVSQSDNFKPVEKAKGNDNNNNKANDESKEKELWDEEDEDFVSLMHLVESLKQYLKKNSETTLNSVFKNENTKTLNGKKVMTYFDFHEILITKGIISKKLSLDEFTEFIIVTESSEDIVVDLDYFFSYLNKHLKQGESSRRSNREEKGKRETETKEEVQEKEAKKNQPAPLLEGIKGNIEVDEEQELVNNIEKVEKVEKKLTERESKKVQEMVDALESERKEEKVLNSGNFDIIDNADSDKGRENIEKEILTSDLDNEINNELGDFDQIV